MATGHRATARLADIADVVLGADDYSVEVNYSGQTAVFMGVFVAPNANSLEVIRTVTAEMEKIKAEELEDTTEFITLINEYNKLKVNITRKIGRMRTTY